MMDIEDAHKLKILTTQETKELLLSYFSKERRAHRLKTMEIVSDTNEQIAYLDVYKRQQFAIVGEPTEMQPAIAEKGLMVLDVTATGKSGHAARDVYKRQVHHRLPPG